METKKKRPYREDPEDLARLAAETPIEDGVSNALVERLRGEFLSKRTDTVALIRDTYVASNRNNTVLAAMLFVLHWYAEDMTITDRHFAMLKEYAILEPAVQERVIGVLEWVRGKKSLDVLDVLIEKLELDQKRPGWLWEYANKVYQEFVKEIQS